MPWTTPDRWPHRALWLWDSAFHAVGWRHLDPGLAREMIDAVFDAQQPDGRVPHMSTPESSSAITQPPVLALAAALVDDVDPDPAWVESIRAALPVLPAARRARLVDELGAEPGDAALLVQRGLDDLVAEAAAAGAPADLVLTRAVHNLADVDPTVLSASHLAQLVSMEAGGDLTATQAKQVLGDMVESGRPPDELAAERGFEAMDSGDLEAIVDAAIAEHRR